MKTCVLIPSYNEEKTIGGIVKKVRALELDVIVVDDGSSDNTEKAAKEAGALVISHPKNHGKGFALRNGFTYTLGQDYEAVITMDGDGQHDVQDIKKFLKATESNPQLGVIVGNRMLNTKDMPFIRFLTNIFMSFVISMFSRQEIADTQCGFRLVRRAVLENIRLFTSNFEIESEILIRAGRLGYKISSIPIQTIYLTKSSKISPFIDTFRFIKFIIKEIWISIF
ncbi:MAG: glycosyltransferase family 2 protein [Candidatus Omnitrophota bacterium]